MEASTRGANPAGTYAHQTRHNDEKESERTDDTAGVIPDDLRTDRSERDGEHGHARARKNQEAKTDEPRTDAGGHMTTDLTDPDHAISDASACAPFQTIVKPGDNGDADTEMSVDTAALRLPPTRRPQAQERLVVRRPQRKTIASPAM